MEVYSFIFVLMAFIVSHFRELLDLGILVFCTLLSLTLFLLSLYWARKDTLMLSNYLLVLNKLFFWGCLSFSFHSFHGHYLLSKQFDDKTMFRSCRASGIVTGLPLEKTGKLSFNFKVSTISCRGNKIDLEKISLNLYRKNHPLSISAGDKLTLDLKLKTPRPSYSINTFDTALWALNNNINAIGYVRKILKHEESYSLLHGFRQKVQMWINELPNGSKIAKATLNALLLGDKSQFSNNQWQQMRDTGTVHLFVVSGLHIGIVVAIGWWLSFYFRMFLSLINHRLYFGILPEAGALIVSFLYVLLAGAGLSTQRAWLMAVILIAGRWFSHQFSVWQRWWFALFVIVLIQPLSVAQSGLWLSFVAVASLLLLQNYKVTGHPWKILWRSQVWVWLGLLPMLLIYFQQLSLISPLVNIVAIGFISLLLICLPVVLFLSYLGFYSPITLLTKLLDYFWYVMEKFSQYAEIYTLTLDQVDTVVFVLLLFSCILILLPINRSIKCIAAMIWLLIIYPPRVKNVPLNQFEATVLNVGQGLSVFIRTNEQNVLFDTGASFAGGFSYFESVVKPFLKSISIDSLDLVTISHVDNDHSGGLKNVQKSYLISSLDSELGGDNSVEYRKCISGKMWHWSGISFHYRQPKTSKFVKSNNRSCVLELGNKSCKILIMGDAEAIIENNLLASQLISKSSVLVVGHHGSNTSTSKPFLKREDFDYAFISNGYLNRYRHPHPKVVKRLKDENITIYRTDLDGSIQVKSDTSGCQISSYKQLAKRYWW